MTLVCKSRSRPSWHNLFVIGEAVKAIPVEILDRDERTPWNEIAAMRDVIGHHYHRSCQRSSIAR